MKNCIAIICSLLISECELQEKCMFPTQLSELTKVNIEDTCTCKQ